MNLRAQEGVVLPLINNVYGMMISGIYEKDTNNDMIHYIGTWKGLLNNRTVILQLDKYTKFKRYYPDGYTYIDEIKGRYIVYEGDIDIILNPVIIASSMEIENPIENAPLFSVGDGRNNKFLLEYTDYQFCRAEGKLYLTRNLANPNELIYGFGLQHSVIFDKDCPYTSEVPIPLPVGTTTLLRIN